MEQLQQLTDPTTRISRNIRIRAARLARSGAVPGLDAEDIEQELRLDLIRRAKNFDPAKSSFDTFADRIVANRVATLASATAAMRAERAMLCIDAPVGDDDGGLTLSDVLPEAAALDPVDEFLIAHGPGLRGDVGRLLAALCPATRQVAMAVSQLSISEAARALGVHRSTIYERLGRIRAIATEMGLDGYFEAAPTVAAPRR
ncbi:RNA polymerase sigma factor, sigma-70 family [Ruegeria intermedia]|uniref:RNA polymerase sigma factor, sigma-70 family n=1 Tax=Ruegeria intermedia TaxID=996115 RepID=A0A1M5BDA0_9RHOB|nr:helix-turn-helix domain-containing protein [Ruegeria intermedia]SHF40469.1 RNA polymerase sigma factor, sigma-70 family [Ruegeria intermedia]